MKRPVFYFLMMFAFVYSTNAQTTQDPFHGHYKLGSSSEIALFLKTSPGNDQFLKHQIFRYYSGSGNYYMDSAASGLYTGNLDPKFSGQDTPPYYFRAVSGDFTGSGLDNIVAAWIANDSSIQIVVPKINKGNLTWNDQNIISIPNGDLAPFGLVNYDYTRFDLVKGYFNSSPNPQFAIAFWNKDGNIEIRIYSVDPNTLMPAQIASVVTDLYMDPTADNMGNYGIAAGDFNGDGIDEIVLADAENTVINTEVYKVVNNSGNMSIVLKSKNNSFNATTTPLHLCVATGNFLNNTLDQFIVDYNYISPTYQYIDLLLPASVDTSLNSININPKNLEQVTPVVSSSNRQISIVSGDLNNDGRDEILADANNVTTLYTIDDTLHLHKVTSINGNTNPVIADLDANTSDSVWTPEIICTSPNYTVNFNTGAYYDYFYINVFEPITDQSGNITSVQERASILADSTKNGSEDYHWIITAGAYDGKTIRLGTPKYYKATHIIQPLVILNAPPTHFDVFNDTTFDINRMYNGTGSSDFYAKYYTQSQTEIDYETENHSSWAVSTEVSGGGKIPIIKTGVEIKIKSEYGQDFSKQTFKNQITTISQNITVTNDDYIYATIMNYDIWEYPILVDNVITGYTLAVSPQPATRAWFPSKSPQAIEYLPDHEVGNILSYYASPSDNTRLKTAVKSQTTDQVDLTNSPNFSHDWSLENKTQTQTTTTNETHWSIEASASFDFPFKFIPDIKLKGSYSNSTLSTTTNKVTYISGLDVHLGPVNSSYYGDGYSVLPYAYWSKSGALVLDYAVTPDAGGINQTETWWQQRYGHKSDPALILPWRLDNYKGGNEPSDQLQETKDILINPENPQPGDTVTIQLRIHNFSLINTPEPVEAKLFVGDPSNGGIPIQSVGGATTFATSDFIPARGSSIISIKWKLPDNTPYYPKIYALLDPNNSFDEIHLSNNIGWTVLNYDGKTTGINDKKIEVSSYKLSQNYPNPFNPTTTIEYAIPRQELVTLKVYDILGREVKTLVNGQMQAGNHSIIFNGNNLASGVYFYRIQAGNFVQTKKLVLLK